MPPVRKYAPKVKHTRLALWFGVVALIAGALARADIVSAQGGSPGTLSFSTAGYDVSEGVGNANISLTRTGGSAGVVTAKVSLSDVTTSPADYHFAPGTLDTSFNPGPGTTNMFVASVSLQPDGKLIIGGNFTSYGGAARSHIARLNADGSLDNSFDPGAGATGAFDVVRATALQPDGKIIIGGSFNRYNGAARNGVARLNPDGSLDTSFNVGTGVDDDNVYSITLQADGKVIIGGSFNRYNGAARNGVARLNPDGSLDTSFNPANPPSVTLMREVRTAVQADGKVIVGGIFFDANGGIATNIARLNADGSLDNSFNVGSGTNNGVQSIAVQPDGKIIIGGGFTTYIGTLRKFIARLNGDGSLDNSFNPDTTINDFVHAIVLQPDGKIIIGGIFNASLKRLNADGSRDTTFAPSSTGDIRTAVLQPDGKVAVGGVFDSYNGVSLNHVARLEGDLFVTWPAGDTANKTIQLPIVDDSIIELNETLTLTLTPVAGGASAGSPSTATLTIMDNDSSVSSVSGSGVFGGTATLTATLSSGGANIGGKTISFTLNGSPVGAATTDASGVATLVGVGLAGVNAGAQNNAVGASFAGDAGIAAGSGTGPLIIAKAGTATALSSSANPSGAGQSVTFTASITSATTGTPTGTVQFKVDGADLGAAVTLNSSGLATLTTSALTAGAHAVAADYSGDPNFNASTGTLAGGQVVGGVFNFSQVNYTVSERDGSIAVTVKRTGETGRAMSVDYAMEDGSISSVAVPCSSVTGLALERCDYTRAAGTLQFAAGEAQKSFVVLVSKDSYTEGTESALLKLSNPGGGAVMGQQSSATLLITDDAQQTSNPIDDSPFFVRQHYHDFLNREPDAAGLQFWTDEIEKCKEDALCREVKRVHVSAAFFLSIEFQQTGFLVELMYKTAYGDATGVSTLGGPHTLAMPVVRLQEFLRDTQEIGRGVVVGQDGWEAQLESNKSAFALAFVRRQRFAEAFPSSLTADGFVTRLDAMAGGVLTDSERAQLDLLFGGPNSPSADEAKRAQALRQVAENQTLRQRESNRAFVLMQFFGYLRRDPNAAPDSDHTGYDFWLGKLNQFGGDFVKAEMVKAFIASDEYRKRFGQ